MEYLVRFILCCDACKTRRATSNKIDFLSLIWLCCKTLSSFACSSIHSITSCHKIHPTVKMKIVLREVTFERPSTRDPLLLSSLPLDPTGRYLRRNHLLLATHHQELSLDQRLAHTQSVPRHPTTEHRRSAQRSTAGGLCPFVG